MNNSLLPLDGIRVLDFSHFQSGPCCGMLLADMGAEVIRIDPPGGGIDRKWGVLGPDGETLTFKALGRNKKGITLSLKSAEGKEILKKLVKRSDVVLNNFVPGSPQARELTYENLKVINPGIITAAVSGFGLYGPDSERGSFDPVAQARSGAMTLNGFPGDPPLKTTVPYIDLSSGISAALGILLALFHRGKTGEGQAVDVALFDVSSFMTQTQGALLYYETYHRLREQYGNFSFNSYSTCLKAKDGWVMVVAGTDPIWHRLLKATGKEHLADDPALQSGYDRSEKAALIDPLFQEWAGQKTVAEIMDIFDAERIPCSPVYSVDHLRDDPQVAAREMVVDVDYPAIGEMPLPGVFVKLSATPASVKYRSPAIGEHNEEIYQGWLGLSPAGMLELKEKGVI